ncbi:MAG TPA: hypothetical protein VKZ85_16180 [Woeseiaceae bacterium]|nr:hypothetical protein [Woeseiaceae bacterium]
MATETSYYDRTIEAVRKQAEARGIVELDGLKAALEQKYGKLVELPDPQLRKLNQELPAFLEAYLGGVKRRGQRLETRAEWNPAAEMNPDADG